MGTKTKEKAKRASAAVACSIAPDDSLAQPLLTDTMYKSFFENSAVAITVTDEHERIVIWNRLAESLLGMASGDLKMKPVRSLYPREEWKRIRSQNIRQKGMQHHLETRMLRKDGEAIDVDLSLSMLKGENGEIVGSIGIIKDITDRKRAQEQLQLAEQKYRTIFENSASAITVTDENESIVAWNEPAEWLLGRSGEDLHMLPVSALYPVAEWHRIRAEDVRRKGRQHHLETRILRKNGELVDVDLSLSVLKGPDGEVTGSIAIITDITEQKKAEDALRRSEEKLKHYLDSSPDAIYTMAIDGTLLYVNRAAEWLTGYVKDELTGNSILRLDLVPPEYLNGVMQTIEANACGMPTGPLEMEIVRKDGRRVFIEVSTYPTGEGRRAEVIGIARDITERKRVEEEKRRMEQQLQLAGRLAAVGELAAGVAHELNNPLSAIQGFAQLLGCKQDMDESIKKDVDTILKEAQRATRITGNLLSFARKHKPEKRPVSVNEIVEKSLELHTYRMWVNNIEISLDLDFELPEIMADIHQLQQVFVNIVNNAEQAMSESNARGKLTVKTHREGDLIKISFIDDGPGIREENLSRIFDPFFTTKDAGKGTGLGLAICYGIVKEHGGRLYAGNNPDGGANLVVEIPILAEDQPNPPTPECASRPQ